MNLYIFPAAPSKNDGYGIGVEYAINKLQPKHDDLIIWYTNVPKETISGFEDHHFIIKKAPLYSIRSVSNILFGRARLELNYRDLSFLQQYDFETIHCDEVYFYRALRRLFPDKKINIRLHNCYARILDRKRLLKLALDPQFTKTLKVMYKLEREIFNDRNTYKIFISEEDRNYYTNNFGITSDSEVWPYVPDVTKSKDEFPQHIDHKLVWFGGIQSHKKASVDWFINSQFPIIKKTLPDIELHMWGYGTRAYNNPTNNVYGYGFYDGKDKYPMSNALYINPDIIGGGIKLKLLKLFEDGVPFITTPFGYEGYSKDLIDNKRIIVAEPHLMAATIIQVISNTYDNH